MNFLFTCGGTGGHINPAIAIANEIKAHQPDAEHNHKIQDHRPQKCDQHKKSPRMEGIIYGFGRHIPAHIPAAAANNEKEFPRQGK